MADIILDIFTPEERALIADLDLERMPRHVAIIMDGNGRWATAQGLPRVIGHRAGVESIRRVMKACRALGIACLTVYSFSTENWGRPDDEVQALMSLHEQSLLVELDEMHREGVRVRHLGRFEMLPESLRRALGDAIERTRANTTLTFTLALNYSGRAELTDAARRLALAAAAGELDPSAITEDTLAGALYAPDLPDPDLCIRTAGELRVSNFLLWQLAYAEFWTTPVLWPDFQPLHLLRAVFDFQCRTRKFGKVVS
ncbi:MAG: Isoprenyl transferase [bacterium ADurb.Bin429]|nr:MAG: Isoprenyl transferase [bacterium ADurb.Bin429]